MNINNLGMNVYFTLEFSGHTPLLRKGRQELKQGRNLAALSGVKATEEGCLQVFFLIALSASYSTQDH